MTLLAAKARQVGLCLDERDCVEPHGVVLVAAGDLLSETSIFGDSNRVEVHRVDEVLLHHHDVDLSAHVTDATR